MEFDRLILRNITKTTRMFHGYVRNECDKIGINASFQGIIRHLAHENGLSQQELAKRLVLAAPTISLTLLKMEYEGLIERRADEVDARVTRVYLTEKGFEVDNEIRSVFKKVEDRISSVISVEEQNAFLTMLEVINTEITKLKEEEHD